jgi:hypothetical protein
MGEDPKLESTPLSPRAEDTPAPCSGSVNALLEDNHRLRRELEEALRLVASERDERRIAELLKYSAVPHVSEPAGLEGSSAPPPTLSVRVDPETSDSLRVIRTTVRKQPTRLWDGVTKALAAIAVVILDRLVEHLLTRGH